MTTDYQTFTTKDMSVEDRRKLNVGDIWSNAITCKKCGDTIRSMNKHDFRRCSCGAVAVDGGSWYGRRVGNPEDYQEIIEPFDSI